MINEQPPQGHSVPPKLCGELAGEKLAELQAATNAILFRMRRATMDIVFIGQQLIEWKAELSHGQFSSWCEEALGINAARRAALMRIARKLGPKVMQLHNSGREVPALAERTLQEMASEAVPEELVDDLLHRASAGEEITAAVVKERAASAQDGETADEPWFVLRHELYSLTREIRDDWEIPDTAEGWAGFMGWGETPQGEKEVEFWIAQGPELDMPLHERAREYTTRLEPIERRVKEGKAAQADLDQARDILAWKYNLR